MPITQLNVIKGNFRKCSSSIVSSSSRPALERMQASAWQHGKRTTTSEPSGREQFFCSVLRPSAFCNNFCPSSVLRPIFPAVCQMRRCLDINHPRREGGACTSRMRVHGGNRFEEMGAPRCPVVPPPAVGQLAGSMACHSYFSTPIQYLTYRS